MFHGSRKENIPGILEKGLLVNPAGVRKSGALFGQGIYFADYANRSSIYCRSNGNDLVIFLCEVALGKSKVVEKT